MSKLKGGCLCGEIRYELSGDPVTSLTCFCRDCQYISGGAQNNSLFFPSQNCVVTKGEPASYVSKSDSGKQVTRQFCSHCGTPLFAESEGLPDMIGVKVGSLDKPIDYRQEANLWVSSSQSWHHIDPDIPKLDKQTS